MSTNTPPGLILLSQAGFFEITPQDVLEALLPEYQLLPKLSVEIDTVAKIKSVGTDAKTPTADQR